MAARFHVLSFWIIAFLALNLSTAISSGANTQSQPAPANIKTHTSGPTLRLNSSGTEALTNRVSEFMYFVPLISKEPVSVVESPANSQYARMLSAKRAFTPQSFEVTCEFEFAGAGHLKNIFDHSAKIQRRAADLKKGVSLRYQLAAINIEGAGNVSVQITGTVSNEVPTVTEVQMRFNDRGRSSPVTIDLHDFYYADNQVRIRNENVARISTLIFHRQAGPAKMEISLTSLKPKAAGSSLWQSFKAGIKSATANMFIKPITIDPAGNDTMLNFGFALATAAPEFTFPLATNRQSGKMEVH